MSAELKEALEGLTEDKFCTGQFAYDDAGHIVSPLSEKASKWCTEGWLHRVDAPIRLFSEAADAAKSLGYECTVEANDLRGYDFVKLLRQEGDK